MKRSLKRSPWTVLVLLLVGLYLAYQEGELFFQKNGFEESSTSAVEAEEIFRAHANRQSDIQVTGEGEIVKLLPDDNEGSRHQKFLVEMGRDLTILIAHNIDLAPRVSPVAEGDTIRFHGEYEWNQKGGVVHWTHHDPGGRHPGGWLEIRGKKFQ